MSKNGIRSFEGPGKKCVGDPLMKGNDPGREVVVEVKDRIARNSEH